MTRTNLGGDPLTAHHGIAAKCSCGEWTTRVNRPPSRGGESRAIKQHKGHLVEVLLAEHASKP